MSRLRRLTLAALLAASSSASPLFAATPPAPTKEERAAFRKARELDKLRPRAEWSQIVSNVARRHIGKRLFAGRACYCRFRCENARSGRGVLQ